MKHYIIVKFKDREDTEKLLPEIKALFQKALDLKGVESVLIHKSNSNRENRYSIMIEMSLSQEGLEAFDASEIQLVQDECKLISLGRRILRTDTAAICTLSMLMIKCEEFIQ